jgi:ribose 1,5-bisphosphokinase PhnN
MRIKKLRLKNGYKRFHDLTIDLGDNPARIVALVGPNGCGKSSVLDGLLFHANAHQQVGDKGNKDHTYHSMEAKPGYDHSNIEIELTTGTFAQLHQGRQTNGSGGTLFSFRSSYRYNSRLKLNAIQSVPEIRLNNYGASSASDLDDKMERNYRRLYASFYKYLREDKTRSMNDAAAKIVGDLNASLERCLDLRVHDIGNIEGDEGTLYFTKADHPKPFDFNVLSAGEKEVVDILLDLYLRKTDFIDTVFLIDEPELHISTAIQRNLLVEINKLIGKDCQLWVATHSIGFFRALQGDLKAECQVIYFDPNEKLGSKAAVLQPMIKSASNWRAVFATALDDLAGLISPRRIIYCEGKDKPVSGKEGGLDADVYNAIFAGEFHDTLFVSSGGNTELDQRSEIALAIMGKVFKEVAIWVLKDRDSGSGIFLDQAARSLYLSNNPKNHRMLVRLEIENYLYDKEVLEAYCVANGLKFDSEAYHKLFSNIVDDNLKDASGKVKSCCGIKGSISKEVFKRNLAQHLVSGMKVYDELKVEIFGETISEALPSH